MNTLHPYTYLYSFILLCQRLQGVEAFPQPQLLAIALWQNHKVFDKVCHIYAIRNPP